MTGCVFELLAMLYEKGLGKHFDVAILRNHTRSNQV